MQPEGWLQLEQGHSTGQYPESRAPSYFSKVHNMVQFA
jgi:hypothetical protein